MDREKKQEFTLRITQANKSGLVVILYDMALAFLEEALEAFRQGENKEYKQGVRKARGCLDELIASLHMDYEPARLLLRLYYFYRRALATAAVRGQPETVLSVMGMLARLRDAYAEAAGQDDSPPLMQNTQAVYAGLTYGRDSLNVSLADQDANRGFRA